MTAASDRAAGTPQPRRFWQRWRERLDAARPLRPRDRQELRQRVAAVERASRDVAAIQQEIARVLSQHGREAPLISPLELATDDRFVLENRCRALTNPVYLGGRTALCRMLGHYKIYLDTDDTGFASHLLLDGFWEMWLTVFFARQVRPGMTVIDVGANYGYYTLLFGSLVGPQGQVFAVEPNPAVVPKLRRSVSLNGLSERTTIVAAAAGARAGDVHLFAPHGEPKNGTIIAGPHVVAPESGTVHAVPQVTADAFAAAADRIDLVKIDAEGAEEGVVAGMTALLERDRPGLLLEFNAARYADPRGFLDRLRALYGRMRYIDFECNASPVAADQLMSERWGEDWMLYFDQPPAL